MAQAGPPRTRRSVLGAVSGLTTIALVGCLGDRTATYETGEIPDVDAESRTPEELAAAEAVAETDVREGVSPLADLAIVDHEFVLEDGYEGATVQGTVTNDRDDRIELVEVRVRVFDADGSQLGRYVARTGDLDGGTDWSFTVVLLEDPAELERYEIAVLGAPS